MTPPALNHAHRLPEQLRAELTSAAPDPRAILRRAPDVVAELRPAAGTTLLSLWEGLAALGSLDLTVARTLEPHLDALTILEEAAIPADRFPADATWGVFAAEGRGTRLTASPSADGSWVLSGRKPWCSLAGILSHALVTAWTSPTERRLFAVALRSPRVRVESGTWVSRGLENVVSSAVDFDDAPAVPVGEDGWYLRRPGFAQGGIGVSAVWWGAASSLANRVHAACSERTPDQIALYHLGRCEMRLHATGTLLAATARDLDADPPREASEAWPTALRVRGTVHEACEATLEAVGSVLGPGPLTQDEVCSRMVADLRIYAQQHKPERDVAGLGQALLDGEPASWSAS